MVDNTKKLHKTAFTIIEVILFVALTGMVFLIIVFSMQGRIANSQFTESMRDIQSYIDSQYSEVFNGVADGVSSGCTVNSGSISSPGGSSECTSLGRVIYFNEKNTSIHTLLGKRLNTEDLQLSDLEVLEEALPTRYASGGNPFEKDYRWGVQMTGFINKAHPTQSTIVKTAPLALGIVRSPASNNILTLAYEDVNKVDSETLSSPYENINGGSARIYTKDKFNIRICFSDNGGKNNAYISIGGDDNNKSVDLTMDEEGCS